MKVQRVGFFCKAGVKDNAGSDLCRSHRHFQPLDVAAAAANVARKSYWQQMCARFSSQPDTRFSWWIFRVKGGVSVGKKIPAIVLFWHGRGGKESDCVLIQVVGLGGVEMTK